MGSGEKTLEGNDSPKPYASVAYCPDGSRRFATTEEPSGVDEDVSHRLRGWTTTTAAELPIRDETFDSFGSFNGSENLFFYPKGDRIIDVAGSDFAVRDVLTLRPTQVLPAYRVAMTQAAFMPDGKRCLVGLPGWESVCFLTDLASGARREWYLPGFRGDAVFLGGGRTLFTHDSTGLYLIDVISSKIVWSLPWEAYTQRITAVSPDGRHIVVSDAIWRDSTPPVPRLVLIRTSAPDKPDVLEAAVWALSFHPDGGRFLAATADAIEERDADTGRRLRSFWNPPGPPPFASGTVPMDNAVLACGAVGHRDPAEPVGAKDEGWVMLGTRPRPKPCRVATGTPAP